MRSVICDLDGVVYRGRETIPGSGVALDRLQRAGIPVVFVTNNSSRTQHKTAEKIRSVVGHEVAPDQIVTSALAAVSILPDSISSCFVVGGEGLETAVLESGREIVESGADAVLVGMDSGFDYKKLTSAADQVRAGALFVASNTDATFPNETGLLPGAGSIVAAIATASGSTAVSAGKPELPMRRLIRNLGVGAAWVIGDRIETDIGLALEEPDWSSILVMTGVAQDGDDLSAADYVVPDLESAVDLVLRDPDRQ